MREITVKENDASQRLDKFLIKTLVKMPVSLVQKSVRKGRIRINGKKTTDPRFSLSVGDVLSLYINDEFFIQDPSEKDFLFCKIPPDIIYEDDNILLVNKPAGLAVHDFEGSGSDTLINRILRYLYDKGQYDFENENSFVPALCNRIDRNTCGIVIAAKNACSLRLLNKKIRDRRIDKRYLCLCRCAPEKSKGELVLYMKKLADKNICLVSDTPEPNFKTAVTQYEVKQNIGEHCLLEITLKTGRTHQIRACLAHIGCSIMGDGKYGKSFAADKAQGFPYQALCSYSVGFHFEKDEPLFYLDGKSFCVPNVWFLK